MSLFDQFMKQAGSILDSLKHESGTTPDAAGGATAEAGGGKSVATSLGLPDISGLFHGVIEMLSQQGLSDLLQKLKDKGLGDIVSSWIGKGTNLPISGEQLQHALGSELLSKLAAKIGLPVEQTAALMSQYLPQIVDKLTPEGVVSEDPAAIAPIKKDGEEA